MGYLNEMRIFVTGGTGVVGRALVETLRARGHTPLLLVRDPAKAKRLFGECEFVEGTMGAPSWSDHASQCDAFVHMAQRESTLPILKRHYRQNEKDDLTCVQALITLAQAGGQHLVYTSGAFVYGHQPSGACSDEDSKLAPFPLVEGKVRSEQKIFESGIKATSLRLGAVTAPYGPFEKFVLTPSIKKKKAMVPGSGEQLSQLLHFQDSANAYVHVLESALTGVFNVGIDEPISAKASAQIVAAQVGAKSPGKIPAFMFRLVAGALGAPLLSNIVFSSEKLRQSGFEFEYKNAEAVIKDVIERYQKEAKS